MKQTFITLVASLYFVYSFVQLNFLKVFVRFPDSVLLSDM
jgi:hypothetical protein